MPGSTDTALLARAVAGDDAAFAELVGPFRGPVFRHCYRMLGSGADAEDATQDTLERAWRRLATYDGSGPFGGWLQRISTNVCIDGLRARRTRIGLVGYGPPRRLALSPGRPTRSWPGSSRSATLSCACRRTRRMRWSGGRRSAWRSWPRCSSWRRASAPRCCCTTCWDSATRRLPTCSRSAPPRSTACCRGPASLSVPARPAAARHHRAPCAAAPAALCPGLAARGYRCLRPARHRRRPLHHAPAHRVVRRPGGRGGVRGERHLRPARPHGVQLRAGSCNGQPAFATYQPDGDGHLVVSGLQVLQLGEVDGQPLITTLVSYRDPALAIRCGLPSSLA